MLNNWLRVLGTVLSEFDLSPNMTDWRGRLQWSGPDICFPLPVLIKGLHLDNKAKKKVIEHLEAVDAIPNPQRADGNIILSMKRMTEELNDCLYSNAANLDFTRDTSLVVGLFLRAIDAHMHTPCPKAQKNFKTHFSLLRFFYKDHTKYKAVHLLDDLLLLDHTKVVSAFNLKPEEIVCAFPDFQLKDWAKFFRDQLNRPKAGNNNEFQPSEGEAEYKVEQPKDEDEPADGVDHDITKHNELKDDQLLVQVQDEAGGPVERDKGAAEAGTGVEVVETGAAAEGQTLKAGGTITNSLADAHVGPASGTPQPGGGSTESTSALTSDAPLLKRRRSTLRSSHPSTKRQKTPTAAFYSASVIDSASSEGEGLLCCFTPPQDADSFALPGQRTIHHPASTATPRSHTLTQANVPLPPVNHVARRGLIPQHSAAPVPQFAPINPALLVILSLPSELGIAQVNPAVNTQSVPKGPLFFSDSESNNPFSGFEFGSHPDDGQEMAFDPGFGDNDLSQFVNYSGSGGQQGGGGASSSAPVALQSQWLSVDTMEEELRQAKQAERQTAKAHATRQATADNFLRNMALPLPAQPPYYLSTIRTDPHSHR